MTVGKIPLFSCGNHPSLHICALHLIPALCPAIPAPSRALKLLKTATLPKTQGPESWFTGTVRVSPLVQGEHPSCLQCANVTFSPGARTAWHTHPKGQLLVVTE